MAPVQPENFCTNETQLNPNRFSSIPSPYQASPPERRFPKTKVGKKGRSRNYRKLPPFVALPWELLNAPAYKSLPGSASRALPYFLGKVKVLFNDPDRYEQEFEFSYNEGRELGFANSTFFGIIQDLMEHGFIDPVSKGGLRSDCKSTSKFALSRRWEDYGTERFKQVNWKSFHSQL